MNSHRTTWLAELDQPIVLASMAGATNGAMAAAVTRAGGLGTVGFASAATPEQVHAEASVAAQAGRFGLGLMLWVVETRPDVLDAAVAASPTLLSLSFGDPQAAVARVRELDSSICLTAQVGTADEARRALEAGVDLLVARGSEGGGHGRGEVATLPLLQQVLELAGEVPVLAAGGIATGRGVAAVLAAGAVGAWVGTPFAACVESPMLESLKDAIVAADSSETVYTRAFDIAQRFAWPEQFGGRALANRFSDQWSGRIDDLVAAVGESDEITDQMFAARSHGDLTIAPAYAGQSAGLVPGTRTVAEVMDELASFRGHVRAAQRFTSGE